MSATNVRGRIYLLPEIVKDDNQPLINLRKTHLDREYSNCSRLGTCNFKVPLPRQARFLLRELDIDRSLCSLATGGRFSSASGSHPPPGPFSWLSSCLGRYLLHELLCRIFDMFTNPPVRPPALPPGSHSPPSASL